ncbi:VOC family protein [Georgenia sp. Z1491]|uniref:VOC family protein n=1 Tax=Georgenia sp. Z1491 TaxID=3416707 RepID=UPI003CF6E1F7
MTTPAQFAIVTLGVADLDLSVDFYRALGWEQRGDKSAGITWFRTSGTWIGLLDHDALADDVGLPADPPTTYRGITLAINVDSVDEAAAAFAHAVGVGARPVKVPEPTEWGGYSGYFADPDGHLWEVAHNPFFPIPDDGTIDIPV